MSTILEIGLIPTEKNTKPLARKIPKMQKSVMKIKKFNATAYDRKQRQANFADIDIVIDIELIR